MAHRMAKHSFLMVLYLVSLFESFRLRYSTGRSSPPTTWARTAPSPVRRVHLQQKGDATQGSLYLGYGLLAQLRPLDRIGCFLFNEISQRAGKLRIIRNKPSIISRQPQELSPSFLVLGLGQAAIAAIYQFGDAPAPSPIGSPDTVPPLAQSHTSAGSPWVQPPSWVLSEFFPDCGGSSQWPINVDTSQTLFDPTLIPVQPLGYNHYGKRTFTLYNNGHTGTFVFYYPFKMVSDLDRHRQKLWNSAIQCFSQYTWLQAASYHIFFLISLCLIFEIYQIQAIFQL